VIPTEVLDKRNEYAAQFSNAKPFRHVEIDGFLDRAICQRLLDDFPSFETRYALNEMGEVGGKAVRMNVREISPAYRQLDQYLQTPEFLDFISAVTGIPELLYDPDYIGGGTHENRDGQSLDAHVDFNYHPRTKTHRRLNLIVYLNREWEDAWGGTLELRSNPWNPAVDEKRSVLPLFNRAVIFETSEVSWHGFCRIELPADRKALSRKSFAIYLYTKDRPRAETAPSHGTIYVPDALPQHFVPGRTLSCVTSMIVSSTPPLRSPPWRAPLPRRALHCACPCKVTPCSPRRRSACGRTAGSAPTSRADLPRNRKCADSNWTCGRRITSTATRP
jgi:hypothetical protein